MDYEKIKKTIFHSYTRPAAKFLGKCLGVSARLIREKRRELSETEFMSWLEDLEWKREKGLSPAEKVYRDDRGRRMTRTLLMRANPNLSSRLATHRLQMWSTGRIQYEDIFKDSLPKNLSSPRYKYKKTDKEAAERLLRRIPGPTEYEREHPELLETSVQSYH